ncbi:MAG: dihydrodipicolinate synthase family protein [Planctomycetes bacterium]|nr:dihydrodipicolinate synthase family protein [Planctomycetota bacterium]
MYLPEGSFAPVPTPLTSQGEFDRGALRTHLAWLAREGLQGALILGSGGEFSSLTLAERADVAQAAGAPGTDFKLILNVGSCALPEALELAGAAAGWGYDALLCPPPFYFRNAHVEGLAALATDAEGERRTEFWRAFLIAAIVLLFSEQTLAWLWGRRR